MKMDIHHETQHWLPLTYPNVDVSEENPDELFDAVLMTVKYVVREANIKKKTSNLFHLVHKCIV